MTMNSASWKTLAFAGILVLGFAAWWLNGADERPNPGQTNDTILGTDLKLLGRVEGFEVYVGDTDGEYAVFKGNHCLFRRSLDDTKGTWIVDHFEDGLLVLTTKTGVSGRCIGRECVVYDGSNGIALFHSDTDGDGLWDFLANNVERVAFRRDGLCWVQSSPKAGTKEEPESQAK